MYVKQPKKLLILNILDILRKYTDEDHRLSQKEIAEILKNEYDMKADRKAIRRNLLNLMDCGYEIEYSETIRNVPVKDKKTGEVLRDKDTGEPTLVGFLSEETVYGRGTQTSDRQPAFFQAHSLQSVQRSGGKAGRSFQYIF